MSRYVFNEIFKQIVDTFYIDCNVLGDMIDRDSSRIRHYKVDSRPGKVVLDKLIVSLCELIDKKNDTYMNTIFMEQINCLIKEKTLFPVELSTALFEITDINTYIAFVLRKSRELNNEPVNPEVSFPKQLIPIEMNSLVTQASLAHQYFESNLYPEAISIYEDILSSSDLCNFPLQKQAVYTELGLIYRNNAFNQYNQELLKKSIEYLDIASKTSLELNDLLNYALINKYLGTIYTFYYNFEDSENNLKRASHYYDIALSVLHNMNNLEEHAKVLINYGVLFLYYASIRNSRNFLKNSISYFKKASDYFDAYPNSFFYALTYLNCANAYCSLAEIFNTEANTAQAIQMANNALKVFTIEDYPLQYSQCVSTLGQIHYTKAAYCDTVKNCNKAIGYINHALTIATEKMDTNTYLIAQLNLSAVYILLSNNIDKQDNIKNAIKCLEKCSKYYQVHCNSMNNLKTNINHAEALIDIAETNNDLSMAKKSEVLLHDIINLCNKSNFSYYKAIAKYSLAKIYFFYYKATGESKHHINALACIRESLNTFTIFDYPLFHAHTMHLAARIYEYIEDFNNSRKAYESILRIINREKYPEKYSILIDEYNELLKNDNVNSI